MSSVEDLTQHLLDDPRCDMRDQPRQDLRIAYINREKMLLINSSHGVSWEDIYGILFPGARVPSPCKQESPRHSFGGQLTLIRLRDLR